MTLRLPALRARLNNIAVLATHFIDHCTALNGLPQKRLSPAALEHLEQHSWRGNARELAKIFARARIRAIGTI